MNTADLLMVLVILVTLLAGVVAHRRLAPAVVAAITGGGARERPSRNKPRRDKQSRDKQSRVTPGRAAAPLPDQTTFPYVAASSPENGGLLPAKDMFRNLQHARPRVQKDVSTKPRVLGNGAILRPGYKFSYVVQRRWPDDMRNSDALGLHYSDGVRSQCRFGARPSPAEVWSRDRQGVEREAEKLRARHPRLSVDDSLREAIYARAPWCNFFNPAFCLWVYRTLARKIGMAAADVRIIDPSAGWGDRALAACAFGAKSYHGYDPNTAMRSAYAAMLKEFAPAGSEYQVSVRPFAVAPGTPEQADIVVTSPPYWDLEDYPAEGGEAGRRHRTYDNWVSGFYRQYLRDAWSSVAPGGVLAMYVENIQRRAGRGTPPQVVPLADDTADILRECGAGEVTDTFGFQQVVDWPERNIDSSGPVRPMFVWRKPARNDAP
jgi:hypothetical protein